MLWGDIMNYNKIIALFLILLLLPLPVVHAANPCDDPTEKHIMRGVGAVFYLTGATIVMTTPFGLATFIGVGFLEAGVLLAIAYAP